MRRGRIISGVAAVSVAALVAAPGTLAGGFTSISPQAKNAITQQYGNGGSKLPTSHNTSKGSNVAGSVATKTPLATTKSGTLPFTGSQLGVFAVVALALVAMGFVLRSTGREAKARE